MYTLRAAARDDGKEIFDMLQDIGKDENGFLNGMQGATYEEFQDWLVKTDDMSKGVGLADWQVPQTTYWLLCDGVPVGFGKLRHALTDKLLVEGGHMGYAIRASRRGEGHGKALCALMLREAERMGIDRVLITVREHNAASARVAQACGGVLEKSENGRLYFWVDLPGRKTDQG